MKRGKYLLLSIYFLMLFITPVLLSGDNNTSKGSSYNSLDSSFSIFSSRYMLPPSVGTTFFDIFTELYPGLACTPSLSGSLTNVPVPVQGTASVIEKRYTSSGMTNGSLNGSIVASNVEYTVQDGDPQIIGITLGRSDWEMIVSSVPTYHGTTYYYYRNTGPILSQFSGGYVEGDIQGEFHFYGIDQYGHPLAQVYITSINGSENPGMFIINFDSPAVNIYPVTTLTHPSVTVIYSSNVGATINYSGSCINSSISQTGSSFYLSGLNVGLFSGLWQSNTTADNGTIFNYSYTHDVGITDVVPRLIGLNQVGAEYLLNFHGFSPGNITSVYDDTYPAGAVISQSIPAGTLSLLSTPINLVVSRGPLLVPNVVGMTQADAVNAIISAGLTTGAVTQMYDSTPAGQVISQTPVAGTSVQAGSSVALTVSLGPAPMFNLTSSVNGGHGALAVSPSSGHYAQGTVVILTATPDANYRVLAWHGTDNDAARTNTNTVTMNADRTVSVEFELIPTYSITARVDSLGGVINLDPDQNSYLEGTTVTASATPSNGWRFDHWEGDASGTNQSTIIRVDSNKTIIAVFIRVYTLSASVIGSYGSISPTSGTYAQGTVITITATPYSGYRIKAWHGTDNDTLTTATNTVTMNANRTVTVEYEQIIYTLTAGTSSQGGIGGIVSLNPDGGSYLMGTQVTAISIPQQGWWFDHWEDGSGTNIGTSPTLVISMVSNKTIIAVFNQTPHFTLSASVTGGHGAVYPVSGIYSLATPPVIQTLTATPEIGYRVKSWHGTDNDSSTSSTNTVTMSDNRVVTVEFEQITFTLTVGTTSPGGMGGSAALNPEEPTYVTGTQVTATATPAQGWWFDHWEDGNGTNIGTGLSLNVTMDGNKIIIAVFNQTPHYTLTASASRGNGTVSPATGTYILATPPVVLTLTANPGFGYRIAAWHGTNNDNSINTTNTVTMNADRNVTVEFEKATYTITKSIVGVGQGQIILHPQQDSYDAGTVVKATASAASGYQFNRWEGDISGTASETYITMDINKAITAVFSPATRYYNYSASVIGGHGSITPISGGYVQGSVVNITASPDPNYRVKAWHNTNNDASKISTNSVTMNANHNVIVEFELIPNSGSTVEEDITTFTLHTSVSGGSGTLTVSPLQTQYLATTRVNLTAIPSSGYKLKSWHGTDNDASLSTSNIVLMNTNRVVTVEYELITYTLTASVAGSGHGSVMATPTAAAYNQGTKVTLIAAPEEGYQVKTWTGTDDEASTANTNTVTMNANRSATVEFETIPVTPEETTKKKDDDNKRWGVCFISTTAPYETIPLVTPMCIIGFLMLIVIARLRKDI